jgi:hypothetical protein
MLKRNFLYREHFFVTEKAFPIFNIVSFRVKKISDQF